MLCYRLTERLEIIVIGSDKDEDAGKQAKMDSEGNPAIQFLASSATTFAARLNAAHAAARGRILTVANNDCKLAPDWLHKIDAAFKTIPDAGPIGGVDALRQRQIVGVQGNTFKCMGKAPKQQKGRDTRCRLQRFHPPKFYFCISARSGHIRLEFDVLDYLLKYHETPTILSALGKLSACALWQPSYTIAVLIQRLRYLQKAACSASHPPRVSRNR